MRIVSKFKDYYDGASAYGIDKECVYVRHTKDLDCKHYVYSDLEHYFTKNYNFEYPNEGFFIGFTGQIFPGIAILKRSRFPIMEIDRNIFFSSDEVIDYMESEGFNLGGRKYLSSRYRDCERYSLTSALDLKDFFETDRNYMQHLFQDHKCPVWMLRDDPKSYLGVLRRKKSSILTLNPRLKPYRFARVKDPVTAFQEIHQYLSGVLGNKENDMVKIDDKYKAEARGFNKWSFKNLPGHKRGRKK